MPFNLFTIFLALLLTPLAKSAAEGGEKQVLQSSATGANAEEEHGEIEMAEQQPPASQTVGKSKKISEI
jgi:hypothetical protein